MSRIRLAGNVQFRVFILGVLVEEEMQKGNYVVGCVDRVGRTLAL